MPKSKYKKYRKGGYLRSMREVAKWLDKDGWIYWNHKPQHPSWMVSMTYRSLDLAARHGRLRRALPNAPEEYLKGGN